MDDQSAYALNSLWTQHYDLGRIVRFRQLPRGRQAVCYEILTAEQQEYCAYLFPPAFDRPNLARMALMLADLDRERFLVPPMLQARGGAWAVGGPQNTHLMVGRAAVGQYRLPDEWQPQALSQLGLRLAWMHRLLAELFPVENEPAPAAALQAALQSPRDAHPFHTLLQADPALVDAIDALQQAIRDLPPPAAWAHGDMQPAAVLLDDDLQIRTFVDFGLLHAGHPLEDLVDAFVHWCIARDGTIHSARGRVLLDSYRSLRDFAAADHPWHEAVYAWLTHRLIDTAGARRALPRNFATYLRTPAMLITALEFCRTP